MLARVHEIKLTMKLLVTTAANKDSQFSEIKTIGNIT